ncbi:ABC-type multidrug transport system fused ATPase/permease subunit [Haloactinopolyspora alba]|uniref:ABC-type multidrug transport system fused ATPase/permease subunit n=1 Tax=Haloactinopolyspora alba TaxID=648780 RepID=A0A2P8DX57_9ACTN|nr:ABC transporter ATP-binding protein [Haloactinopolyspora alba]PSL01810.1 ABC-type multidrug transport system fused ATPase/permease subunit [Haloactinopolyspora alba]
MTGLPVASATRARAHARRLALRHPAELGRVVVLHILAAASGLVVPWLLGRLVEDVARGTDTVDRVAVLICAFVVTQAALTGFAMLASARLGEKVLAQLREEFVDDVLALPQSTVERAGTGDLVTRTTRDVDLLSRAVRHAIPETLISAVTIVLTLGGLVLLGPLLALPCLVAVPILWAATRWFLARARDAYLRENASYTRIAAGLSETADGARTVEALRIGARRRARADDDIAAADAAERYTMRLRTVFLPIVDTAYVLPVVTTLVIGGAFHLNGLASLGAVTAATLYVQQLLTPVDTLLFWLNELQLGSAALARLLGVRRPDQPTCDDDATTGPAFPGPSRSAPLVLATPVSAAGDRAGIAAHGVSFGYRDAVDVLRDVDLEVGPGERLAIVGASGAGKSTLGRVLAGVHRPRAGSITVDDVDVGGLPLEQLRTEITLVTQEHHVFRGSLRDNVVLPVPDADDAAVEHALRAVDAWDWAADLGLDARVGSGGTALSPAQAQQLALARLTLADPHTVILDEATSVLDPRSARHVERSLAAVLAGRTVIAIAHRLHTAHDADRIAVMEEGRIVELGSHDDLLRAGGAYAALWNSWHGHPDRP